MNRYGSATLSVGVQTVWVFRTNLTMMINGCYCDNGMNRAQIHSRVEEVKAKITKVADEVSVKFLRGLIL